MVDFVFSRDGHFGLAMTSGFEMTGSILTILGANTCHGRCRQVSLKVLAGVGRWHKKLRQVSAKYDPDQAFA